MTRNAASDTRDDSTLIDWSEISRLADVDRARLFERALEQIDDALSAPDQGNRLARVETILMNLGSAENLRI